MEQYSPFASIKLINASIKEARTMLEHYKIEYKAVGGGTRCYVPKHIKAQENRIRILEDIRLKVVDP